MSDTEQSVRRYRKKPVEIEARRLPDDWRENGAPQVVMEIAGWCGGWVVYPPGIRIPTLEGEMRAEPGDYVICGVAGEFYPCKPDIFAATYERCSS